MVTRRTPSDRSQQRDDPYHLELLDRLARNLREHREKLDLTQEDAAARCGWTDARVLQMLENGKTNPTMSTLARIGRGLQIEVADLLSPAGPRRRIRKPPFGPVTDEDE